MVRVRKVLLESVRQMKKKRGEREFEPKGDKDLFEKRRNSPDLPISFSEGRRVSVLDFIH